MQHSITFPGMPNWQAIILTFPHVNFLFLKPPERFLKEVSDFNLNKPYARPSGYAKTTAELPEKLLDIIIHTAGLLKPADYAN